MNDDIGEPSKKSGQLVLKPSTTVANAWWQIYPWMVDKRVTTTLLMVVGRDRHSSCCQAILSTLKDSALHITNVSDPIPSSADPKYCLLARMDPNTFVFQRKTCHPYIIPHTSKTTRNTRMHAGPLLVHCSRFPFGIALFHHKTASLKS